MIEDRPYSAAAQRNREPIRAVLEAWLPASAAETGRMLEIGAGTGQHARHFARSFPRWSWQPTDHPARLPQLREGLHDVGLNNLEPPLPLDVTGPWPAGPWDAIYSANTAHIMNWPAVEAMFAGVAESLSPKARFFLYGPFLRAGRHHAPSNAEFDLALRDRPGGMGIRDLLDLDRLAGAVGLKRIAELRMPANNHILLFERVGE